MSGNAFIIRVKEHEPPSFYKATGAEAMSEWTVCRLESGRIAAISEGAVPA